LTHTTRANDTVDTSWLGLVAIMIVNYSKMEKFAVSELKVISVVAAAAADDDVAG